MRQRSGHAFTVGLERAHLEDRASGARAEMVGALVDAGWSQYQDIRRLCEAFPRLDAAAIREALAYYEAHPDEIERYIAENEEDGER